MQQELAGSDVRILGVNDVGASAGNVSVCDGRDIPWLQEDGLQKAGELWNVTYRDVVILDRDNIPVAVYNPTEHNLADPADYAELKALLESY